MRILFVAVLQLLVFSIVSAATLKEQCEKLNPELRRAWINGTCFVLGNQVPPDGYNMFWNMGKYCNHLPENHGRFATITTKEELAELARQRLYGDMIGGEAWIGAIQTPTDVGNCGRTPCAHDVHSRNWWFIDEKGNKRVEVNPELWDDGQPDNMKAAREEHAAVLFGSSARLTLHDYNAQTATFYVVCQYQDVETLKQRCLQLDPSLKKAFVGRSCFVVTTNKTTEGYNTHRNMRKYCNHMPGFRGRMATINKKQQIDELVKQKMIVAGDDLLIGAIQDPSDQGTCGNDPCGPEIHNNNWYFFDENGKRLEALNAELWGKGEPNNHGQAPFANAVSIRASPSSSEVALNDASVNSDNMKLLCQYDL